MSKWTRIGDDDFAPFGKRTITFPIGRAMYVVEVDESDQNIIVVTYGAAETYWAIFLKEEKSGVFRLSGMTGGRGDPHWSEDDHENSGYWFELILSTRATLRYWGDRVIMHEDVEA